MENADEEKWYKTSDTILQRFIKKPKNRLVAGVLIWTMFPDNNDDRMYVLYEMFCDYMCGIRKNTLFHQLQGGRVMWDHPVITKIVSNDMFQELDDFICKPPDVDEGVIECRKCKGRKTLSYSKQTRRADESATVFVKCVQCHASFRL